MLSLTEDDVNGIREGDILYNRDVDKVYIVYGVRNNYAYSRTGELRLVGKMVQYFDVAGVTHGGSSNSAFAKGGFSKLIRDVTGHAAHSIRVRRGDGFLTECCKRREGILKMCF